MRFFIHCLILGISIIPSASLAESPTLCERVEATPVNATLLGHLVTIEEALAIVIDEMKDEHQQRFVQRLAKRMDLVREVFLAEHWDSHATNLDVDAYFAGAKCAAYNLEFGVTEGFGYETGKLLESFGVFLPKQNIGPTKSFERTD